MNLILLIIMFILAVSFINYLIYRQRRDTYLKAGKKWDRIVKELSKRK